jgi:hypothetical protein
VPAHLFGHCLYLAGSHVLNVHLREHPNQRFSSLVPLEAPPFGTGRAGLVGLAVQLADRGSVASGRSSQRGIPGVWRAPALPGP